MSKRFIDTGLCPSAGSVELRHPKAGVAVHPNQL